MEPIEIEEKESTGVKLHSFKSLVSGYIRTIEFAAINDNKNQCVMMSFSDVCQMCYLFYCGLWANLYLLNGSGEDGDEYWCNGLVMINLTDGRFNHLNIYDIEDENQLTTLDEHWDKSNCGICGVQSLLLPQKLLELDSIKGCGKLIDGNKTYNIIFRCGGTTIATWRNSFQLTAFIFKYTSDLITYIDDRIYNAFAELHHDELQHVSVDALNCYQIQLPNLERFRDIILSERIDDACQCITTFSRVHGLIVVFIHSKKVFRFDWFGTFEWIQLEDINHEDRYKSMCLVMDAKGNEQLFVTGVVQKVIFTALYSFEDDSWSEFRHVTEDYEDNELECGNIICFDSKRSRVYMVGKEVICYDLNENECKSMFPPLSTVNEGASTVVAFMDMFSQDYLYVGGADAPLICIDVTDAEAEWQMSQTQFHELLVHSPVHDTYTYERLFCSQ